MAGLAGWMAVVAPLMAVLFGDVIALARARARRVGIERLIERLGKSAAWRVVDRDRYGASVEITIVPSADHMAATSDGTGRSAAWQW